jgi:predicted RNA-binding Zn-ribbon protein involved in translation (DUF1610 family)
MAQKGRPPNIAPSFQNCPKCGHDKIEPEFIKLTHLPKDDDGSPDYETTMRVELYVCENCGNIQLKRDHPTDNFHPVYRKQFERLKTS